MSYVPIIMDTIHMIVVMIRQCIILAEPILLMLEALTCDMVVMIDFHNNYYAIVNSASPNVMIFSLRLFITSG